MFIPQIVLGIQSSCQFLTDHTIDIGWMDSRQAFTEQFCLLVWPSCVLPQLLNYVYVCLFTAIVWRGSLCLFCMYVVCVFVWFSMAHVIIVLKWMTDPFGSIQHHSLTWHELSSCPIITDFGKAAYKKLRIKSRRLYTNRRRSSPCQNEASHIWSFSFT